MKSGSTLLKPIYLFLIFIVFIGSFPLQAADNRPASNSLVIENGAISADLRSVALKDVLEEIKSISGFEYKGSEGLLNETVTISFKGLSMEDSLKRILSHFNCSIIYDSDGQPKSVFILGKVDKKTGVAGYTRPQNESTGNEQRLEQIKSEDEYTSAATTSQFKKITIQRDISPIIITHSTGLISSDDLRTGAAAR